MPDENEQTEGTDDATGANDQPNSGEKTSDKLTNEQRKLIDDHVNSFIGQRLDRAKKEWQAEQDTQREKENDAATQERLKEQEKWRELAEGHEAKVKDLEPELEAINATLAQYQETLASILKTRLDALGEKATTAVDNLPGEPDSLEKLQWLEANEDLFKADATPGHGTPPKKGAAIKNSWNQNRQQPAPQEQTDNYTVKI